MRAIHICIILIMAAATSQAQDKFDLQGHRGCRGLMPENTIPAFIKALDLGCTTLELDVVITADKRVVVSHESYMNPVTCLDSTGAPITKETQKSFNIFKMTYDQVKKFDCGSVPHPDFPEQKKMKVIKPLLSDVINAAELYARQKQLPPVRYNIEIKSSPGGDNLDHPEPQNFSDLVMAVISEAKIKGRFSIQSFDLRPLQYIHKTYPDVPLALLVANAKSMEKNISDLGFTPAIYSPFHVLVTRKVVKRAHAAGMKIIPWTINKESDMLKMSRLGVDGLITDYPDRFNSGK
jgi:glycerophosphoryl diester phosphodiesterase